MKRWAVVAAGTVMLAGCAGPDDACQPAPAAAAEAISEGINDSGATLLDGGYITSENDLAWVTYRMDLGDGEDPVPATWVMASADGEGPIMSADSYAAGWTDWPEMDGANGSDLMDRSQSCVQD